MRTRHLLAIALVTAATAAALAACTGDGATPGPATTTADPGPRPDDVVATETLAANEVPVAAVQYYDDPYVDLDLALATSLGNSQVWVTNEYLHDGLRVAGDTILPRLADLTAGRWTVTSR